MNVKNDWSNDYTNTIHYSNNNDQRFIGPLIPFLGGAAIGYFAGRPQYNYSYPVFYPIYYPQYYSRPYYNNYSSGNYINY